jgi:hypothetical protein
MSPSDSTTNLDTSLLGRALQNLVRGTPTDNESLLACVESNDYALESTRATCRCHYLQLDGNGRPRAEALVERLCEYVLDYAIPRRKIEEVRDDITTRQLVRLTNEAKGLFTRLSNTGEGGELLLWMLSEMILGLPQVICKMSLKTSGNVHYHGIDGIHAGVDDGSETLCLYWGESKFHASFSGAVNRCFNDIAPFLTEPITSSSRQSRDLVLLRDNVDLNDDRLEAAFKRFIDPDDPQFNRLECRGLALVGFDCDHYPSAPNEMVQSQIDDAMANAVAQWHSSITTRITATSLTSFVIHCFCMPVPSVERMRELFLEGLGHTNNATE